MSAETPLQRWIREPKALEAAGVNRSTLQNWIRSGLLPGDRGPAWMREQVHELRILRELRAHLQLDVLALRWPRMRDDGTVGGIVEAAANLADGARFDLVLRLVETNVAIATTDAELAAQVRFSGAPEPVLVLDLSPAVSLVNRTFSAWEETGPAPTERRAGRPPSRRSATASEAS